MQDDTRQKTNSTNTTALHKRGRPRTGGIYLRGGVYWLRYQLNGKRCAESLEVSTEREAKAEAVRRLAPIRASDHAATLRAIQSRLQDAEMAAIAANDKVSPPLALGAAWTEFLKSDIVPAGRATLAQYEGHWNAFCKWLAEKHPEVVAMRDVSAETAAAYIKILAERGLTGQRVNKHLQFLRSFYRELTKAARIAVNPFDGIKRRKQAGTSKRPLTVEEIKAVIQSADGELQTLFMLGTFLGLRLGDCATLLWSEVDLARGVVLRTPRKTAYKGKAGAVVVGIPATLRKHLSAMDRGGKYVVPECAAQYEKAAPVLSRGIQAVFTKCGIETVQEGSGEGTGKRAVVLAGFHSLRHSYISIMAQAGTPQAVLQKLAGHGNPIMTEHYTHISDETARATAAHMPALLGDGKKCKAEREPLPTWAVAKLRRMSVANWDKVRNSMLEGLVK